VKVVQEEITVQAHGQGFVEITDEAARFVAQSGIQAGLLHLFVRHTSCSLMIQENADPSVLVDVRDFFARIAPEGRHYAHASEGPDDMPAHLRTMLTGVGLSVPIVRGQLGLGTWQGIFLCEHRRIARQRRILLTAIGE